MLATTIRRAAAAATATVRAPVLRSASMATSSSSSSSSNGASEPKFYILQYSYTPDIVEKRGPFRSEHLALAQALKAEGKVVMAGALVDPVDTGVFIFRTSDPRDIDAFVAQDPYVRNDLVTAHSIREWAVAV